MRSFVHGGDDMRATRSVSTGLAVQTSASTLGWAVNGQAEVPAGGQVEVPTLHASIGYVTRPSLGGFGAVAMNAALTASMTTLPGQPRKTLTWDRGK